QQASCCDAQLGSFGIHGGFLTWQLSQVRMWILRWGRLLFPDITQRAGAALMDPGEIIAEFLRSRCAASAQVSAV
ncbi:MAG: hypothetical protein QOH07_1583, partial [Mycobacterium sp.]|nr:hypothetical protein [Mycobacterium sp.]